MNRTGAWIIGILLLFILALIGAVLVAESGLINVAATYPDTKTISWFLNTTSARSIARHAAHITAPNLDDPAMVKMGFSHYEVMCVECHGAPGVDPADLAAGLNPQPPLLQRTIDDMSANEVFWVTKNGIRMTGMPGWGPTHNDDDIWAMTAFVKQLPTLTPAQYKALQKSVPPAME